MSPEVVDDNMDLQLCLFHSSTSSDGVRFVGEVNVELYLPKCFLVLPANGIGNYCAIRDDWAIKFYNLLV